MSRLLLLSLACLLAACGQKGALYLPTKPVVPVTVPVAPLSPPQPTPAAFPEATPASVPAVQESTAKDATDTPATAPRP